MKNYFTFFLCLFLGTTNAITFQIGIDKPYSSPNELYSENVVNDGDTIEIDAADYVGNAALAVWQKNDLLIRGVGGRPHLKVNGEYIWGKGIWVFAGNNITVENIEFSGATVPDENGAGIRLDGEGVTVRYCYFHDNENGVLTSNPYAGDILVEHSEFAHNGFGGGFTHNIYVGHVNSLTFRYNYTHHTKVGHCIKSRANENYILYNRIMDEDSGFSSRLIDLSNGGFSIVMGNLMMQGTEAINNNLLGYGLEGVSNDGPNELYFINNTCVNERIASCVFVHLAEETELSVIANNIFAGGGTILNGEASSFTNNTASSIEDFDFVDIDNFDYHLLENSVAIEAGTLLSTANGISLIADKSYLHPTDFTERTLVGNQIDVGAYEYGVVSSVEEYGKIEGLIYPNPTTDFLVLPKLLENGNFEIVTINGKRVKEGVLKNDKLILTDLVAGYYLLIVEKNGNFNFYNFYKN